VVHQTANLHERQWSIRRLCRQVSENHPRLNARRV